MGIERRPCWVTEKGLEKSETFFYSFAGGKKKSIEVLLTYLDWKNKTSIFSVAA
jgi:hypothetical protein